MTAAYCLRCKHADFAHTNQAHRADHWGKYGKACENTGQFDAGLCDTCKKQQGCNLCICVQLVTRKDP